MNDIIKIMDEIRSEYIKYRNIYKVLRIGICIVVV